MKKTIARLMILLMVLNIGVFKGSYANGGSPVLTFVDSTETGATFEYNSGTSGTLYYMVTTEDIAPSPEQVKAAALTGVISHTLVAKGSAAVVPGTGTLSISGLQGRNYTLHTTLEHGSTFETVIVKEFTALWYQLTPTEVMKDVDKLIIKSKFNNSGYLYVGVYKDATGITAMDVVSEGNLPTVGTANKIYVLPPQLITNAIEATTILPGLKGNEAYDLVFVKKDMFGNVSQSVQVLDNVMTRANVLINAVYVNTSYQLGDEKIYLYFKDSIDHPGTESNYTVSFSNNTSASAVTLLDADFTMEKSTIVDNCVVLTLESTGYNKLDSIGLAYNISGMMTVVVNNSGDFQPHVGSESNTTTFPMGDGILISEVYKPAMIAAEYQNLGIGDLAGDTITITMDDYLNVTPSAINFSVSAKSPISSDVLAILTPEVDFTVNMIDEIGCTTGSAISFDLVITSQGAIKLAPLPTSLLKIAVNPPVYPQVDSDFNPFVTDIYVFRLSSVSTLSMIELYGQPIANFNAQILSYTVTVPYAVLKKFNNTPAGALKAVPSDGQSYSIIGTLGSSKSYILVIAADGSESTYQVDTLANVLTLGGIAINGKKVDAFNPYATSYAYTITDSISPIPVLTVEHEVGITVNITSVLSTSVANTYVYTVILVGSETTATYTVTVTGAPAGETPVTPPIDQPVTPPIVEPVTPPIDQPVTPPTHDTKEDKEDKENNNNNNNANNANSGSGSTATPVVDSTAEINNLISLPMENLTGQNIANNIKNIEKSMDGIVNDKQAFDTLTKMDDLVKKVSDSMTSSSTEKKELSTMVTQMSTKMEEKLSMIENPENRMVVLDQFLTEIKLFKVKAGEPMTTMDKSVEDMVQKTANAFGTLKLEAPAAGEATKIDDKTLANVIEKQTEALKKLSQIQQTYFDTSATRSIKKEIKIESNLAVSAALLKVDLAANQVGTLKEAKIDFVTISNVNAEIKLPVLNLKPSESAQVVIEKMPTAVAGSVGNDLGPKFIYDVEFLINNVPQQKFSKPITLAFNLVTFELQKESPLELSIFKLNAQTNVWEPVGGIVDPETFKIFVTRDNLSQYTVLKSKKSFSDADQSWAKAEINALLNKGIVSETTKFEPQSALTRGEFAQWIAKAYGLKVSDQNLPFKDVAKTGASYEAIAAVYQQGILSGKSKTNFDPNGKVTQNEMAAVLGKLLVSFDNKEKSGKITSKYLSQLKTTQVASWAEDDMALLMELGLNISGKNGGETVTKEAAASAFMKFYRS